MTTVIKTNANHPLHITLTILTLGFWLPVWLIATIKGRRTVIQTSFPAGWYVLQDRPGYRAYWNGCVYTHVQPLGYVPVTGS